MKIPKYSVVIPIYNSHPYIRATLDSVLAQTEQDFEVIVVDDGSPNPEGAEIVRSYADPRIRLVVQENKGLPGARNRGIQEAKGEYVALLDGDDIWYSFHLKGAADFFSRYPQVGWYTAHLMEVEFGRPIPEVIYKNQFVVRQPYDGVSPGHSSAMVIRRELLLKSGGFPESFTKGQEDRIAYAKLAKIMPVIGVLSGTSAVYTKHPGSITKTVDRQYDFDYWKGVLSVLLPIGMHPKRKNNSSVREVVEFMLRVGYLTRPSTELSALMQEVRSTYSLLTYCSHKITIAYCAWLRRRRASTDARWLAYSEVYPRMTWKGRFLYLWKSRHGRLILNAELLVFTFLTLVDRVIVFAENDRLRLMERLATRKLLADGGLGENG